MRTKVFAILLIVLSLLPTVAALAGVGDPVVSSAILEESKRRKKVIRTYIGGQLLENKMLYEMGQNIRAEVDLQREFLEYLNGVHDFIGIGMELYAIYTEIKRTKDLISDIGKILSEAPTNSLAVAMHPNQNQMYLAVINSSLDVAKEIIMVFSNKHPQTEQDRFRSANRIRLKCRAMNKNLAALACYLQSTTITDIVHLILHKAKYYDRKRMHEIAKARRKMWEYNFRKSMRRVDEAVELPEMVDDIINDD